MAQGLRHFLSVTARGLKIPRWVAQATRRPERASRPFHRVFRQALRMFLICLLLLPCLPARAEQIKFDSMQVGSKSYKKVVVLGFNATDVYFTHSKGISNERLKRLDPELQKRFNYDEAVAANAERQQAEDNAEFNKQLVVTIEDNARRTYESKRRSDSTYAESLTDPLTEKSPVGNALPELKIESWIGGKPDTKDKFQLIYIWAHWSHASKKFLPDINLLHGKFATEASVFGVISEAAPKPEDDGGVHTEFPNGIDPSSKLIGDLSITQVPQVVFADPKGVIRYIGHPAALTEKRVEELIRKFAAQ